MAAAVAARRSSGEARPTIASRTTVSAAPGPRGGKRGTGGGGGRSRSGGRGASLGAATTAIPGVVFQGSSDGKLYAVSAADGKQIWEYATAREFETINRVPAHGGAISTPGAVIVKGG